MIEFLIVLCSILLWGLIVVGVVQFVLYRRISLLGGVEHRLARLEWKPLSPASTVVAVPPAPPEAPGLHEHEPYVYNVEELRELVLVGLGSDGRPTHRERALGTREHHACRICSIILD